MALNHWVGTGRICHDLQLKTTTNGKNVVTFTLAVERNYSANGERKQTDFISCVAWEHTATFITRFFSKGSLICVEGSIQTRSFNAQDGSKRYVTEVNVTNGYFTGEKKETPTTASTTPTDAYDPYANNSSTEFIDNGDELPF